MRISRKWELIIPGTIENRKNSINTENNDGKMK